MRFLDLSLVIEDGLKSLLSAFPPKYRIVCRLPMIFKKFFLAEGFSDALFETGGILGENADGFACSRDGNIPLF